jgi:MazG family protein
MAVLRSPGGCPWDLAQTHESLRPYLIEEAYEALEAIDQGDRAALCGELGDVLLQCVFHAQLASDSGQFTIAEVIDTLVDKLVRRHPHVFHPSGRRLPIRAKARQAASTPAGVVDQWSRIKAGEQESAGAAPRVLAGIPRALPALLRAHKIGTRVASVGFDWPTAEGVLDKVAEEIAELRQALTESPARAAEEMGDLLFSVANLARALSIDPERALSSANDKFTRRFDSVEALLASQGQSVHHASPAQLDAAWHIVKQAEEVSTTRSSTTPVRSKSTRGPLGRRSRR